MIDERELLARTAERFTMPEPGLERLRRRRDRKRRNERLAAGAMGMTIAVAVVAIALGIAGGETPTGNAGTDPSPSGAPTGPVRFESTHHGYALTHPADWTATASPTAWTSGPLTGDDADVFRGVDTEGILLSAGSIEIPEGMTEAEWIAREQRRAVHAAGLGGGAGSFFAPTTVDGTEGSLSVDCGLMLVAEGGRGYVFNLYGDITVNTDLRTAVRSIELHPEDAG